MRSSARSLRRLITNYRAAAPGSGYANDEPIGLFSVVDAQWRLRFWESGGSISGGLLRADIRVVSYNWWSTQVLIRTDDGSIEGSFRLPFSSTRRVRRQLANHTRAASQLVDFHERSRRGEWWLDPEALTEVGPARTISITETRYREGWEGQIRSFRQSRRRILDLDPQGIRLRGTRQRLRIRWEDIEGLDIDAAGPTTASLTVRRSGAAAVRFETTRYTAVELAAKLAPVRDRMAGAEPLRPAD